MKSILHVYWKAILMVAKGSDMQTIFLFIFSSSLLMCHTTVVLGMDGLRISRGLD